MSVFTAVSARGNCAKLQTRLMKRRAFLWEPPKRNFNSAASTATSSSVTPCNSRAQSASKSTSKSVSVSSAMLSRCSLDCLSRWLGRRSPAGVLSRNRVSRSDGNLTLLLKAARSTGSWCRASRLTRAKLPMTTVRSKFMNAREEQANHAEYQSVAASGDASWRSSYPMPSFTDNNKVTIAVRKDWKPSTRWPKSQWLDQAKPVKRTA
mmetsp:Transcript_51313/g.159034  ORF Transcript_51313/g.159034 Transcript_51313/m.159034 type:complete len:208 (-) Transcript_51313:751-1374(-)